MPQFRNADNKAFYDYWMSLNEGMVPHFRAWDPILVPRQMPWCTIVERGGATGYRLRFAGTGICGFYNEEMTGQEVGHRMDPKTRAFYFRSIEETLTRPCGMFFSSKARTATGRDCLFDTIALPLCDENGLGCRLMTHQAIIEELTFGEQRSRFSMPDVAEIFDLSSARGDDFEDAAVRSS